jgi:mannose-1-phosphate guanylyltransferase/mannose-6-phosphate isomerase
VTPITPVILSGGSGTRLWPLSRELKPKQFLPLVTGNTMLQETVLRTASLQQDAQPPLIVCNDAHRFLVAEQMLEIGVEPEAIVLEPAGRNTAPAVAVAALLALRSAPEDTDPLLLVLPADHVILESAAFAAAVDAAADAAGAGKLVTFGIVPDRPETGYGYILKGPAQGRHFALERFVEKPDPATAQSFVDSGRYLWNSGMFLFSARVYLDELADFLGCPSDSIDYAVMEKTENAAVVPLEAGWSDVGSWATLRDVLGTNTQGNTIVGDVISQDCRGSYIASHSRLVAVVGVEDLVVIETDDVVMIAPIAQSQGVKRLVDELKASGRPEVR